MLEDLIKYTKLGKVFFHKQKARLVTDVIDKLKEKTA